MRRDSADSAGTAAPSLLHVAVPELSVSAAGLCTSHIECLQIGALMFCIVAAVLSGRLCPEQAENTKM